MIIIELNIDEDITRASLEQFLKLTESAEPNPAYNDNLELTGMWARLDG